MADDSTLARGIVVILKACLGLSATSDAELDRRAEKLLVCVKAGESETALRMQVAKIQYQFNHEVNDGACKKAVERIRKPCE